MASMAPRPHALVIGSFPVGARLTLSPGQALPCDGCRQPLVGSGRRYSSIILCPPCSTADLQE